MAIPRVVDNNLFQQRRFVAQSMMEISLILVNAAQLRYVLEAGSSHAYFYPGLIMIILSILLQIAVGIALTIIHQQDIANLEQMDTANTINNYILIAIFLIIILNAFISVFIT